MKRTPQFLEFTCLILIYGLLLLGCRKNPSPPADPGNPPPGIPAGSFNADSISNHLRFLKAIKKPGLIPKASAGADLKISFEDTLYLTDQLKKPIKFLHLDTTKDVAGMYLQVHGAVIGSTNATYFYDVPEIPEMADNDTVSVCLMGVDPFAIDPSGGKLPIYYITIVCYGKRGELLDQTTRPVVIDEPGKDPGSGSCGLVLPTGQYWYWDLTLIEDPNGNSLVFYNDPDKKWGAGGQFIKGCCINGKSSYDINCAGNTTAQRTLHFKTFFVYEEEIMQFFKDGTFQRNTRELHSLPSPEKSDFCGTDPGEVHWERSSVYYFGNWTVNTLTTPFQGDSLNLTMFTTTKTGGTGFGRTGGIIHQLDCNVLALIQPDREGQGHHSVTFFNRVHAPEEEGWYVMT